MKPGDLVVLLSSEVIGYYSIEIPLGTVVKDIGNNGGKWSIICEFFTMNSPNKQIYMARNEIKLFFNRIR